MWSRAISIALFFATQVLLSTSIFSQEALVSLEETAPAELCPSCKSLNFLVKPGKQTIHLTEAPKVESVLLGGERKSVQGFTAQWVGEQKPREIKITLDTKELVLSGTYDIYLNLQPKSNAEAPRLKLQIFHPAPKIAPIPKLILDRTYYFIGISADSNPEVFLDEISQKSNLSNLKINKVGNASIGALPIGGSLQILNPPQEMTAGQREKINYRIANNFDLGTASGTMKIQSAEVIDPLGTFDFEVRSHVHWLYIGLTIAIGLFCSYFLKVHLQQRLELDQARLDARRLLDRIAAEELLHADTVFTNAYRTQLNLLNTALNGTNPTDINNAKTALDTAWRTALQDLTKRHQDQLDALDKLGDITKLDWPVPPTVSAPIVAARAALVQVVTLIERDDLAQAQTQRQQAVLDLGADVLHAALAWQNAVIQIVDNLQHNPNGISKSTSEALAKPAQDLVVSLTKISANTSMATPEQIQQSLSDIRLERLLVRQFVDWLVRTIKTEMSTAESLIEMANLSGWNAAKFAMLPNAVDAFIVFLDSTVDNPDPVAMA
ncbi:MAG TPA: hypothetical protein VGV87_09020, partial [Blastocatellia bacterium]|nr:hypothetical protein [Blastocatellia bacterium]